MILPFDSVSCFSDLASIDRLNMIFRTKLLRTCRIILILLQQNSKAAEQAAPIFRRFVGVFADGNFIVVLIFTIETWAYPLCKSLLKLNSPVK